MSPVAADCASADKAPGALASLVVAAGDAEVVVVAGAIVEFDGRSFHPRPRYHDFRIAAGHDQRGQLSWSVGG